MDVKYINQHKPYLIFLNLLLDIFYRILGGYTTTIYFAVGMINLVAQSTSTLLEKSLIALSKIPLRCQIDISLPY